MDRPSIAYIRSQDIVVRPMDGAAVLVNERKHLYFAVNRVGARIWDLLEEPKSMESIVEALAREFTIGNDLCRAETEQFLTQLVARELVHTRAIG